MQLEKHVPGLNAQRVRPRHTLALDEHFNRDRLVIRMPGVGAERQAIEV